MFNLAQRQLRISLRGSESANRSNAKNLSEKRKLSLVQWPQDLGANLIELKPLLVVSVRRIAALSCLFLRLHFALF